MATPRSETYYAASGAQGAQPFTKWAYIPALKCFAWSDGPKTAAPNTQTGISNFGAMQLYRPLGT
jgi:hypothetical protein